MRFQPEGLSTDNGSVGLGEGTNGGRTCGSGPLLHMACLSSLTDVDMDAVVSGQQQVTVKGEHMNVAQVSHGSEKIS